MDETAVAPSIAEEETTLMPAVVEDQTPFASKAITMERATPAPVVAVVEPPPAPAEVVKDAELTRHAAAKEATGVAIVESGPRRALAFGRDTLYKLLWAAGAGLATRAAGGWNSDEMVYFALMIGCVVLIALLADGYPRRLFGALGFAFSVLYTLFLLDMADQRGATTAAGSESRDLLLIAIGGSMTLLIICILRLLPPRRQTG